MRCALVFILNYALLPLAVTVPLTDEADSDVTAMSSTAELKLTGTQAQAGISSQLSAQKANCTSGTRCRSSRSFFCGWEQTSGGGANWQLASSISSATGLSTSFITSSVSKLGNLTSLTHPSWSCLTSPPVELEKGTLNCFVTVAYQLTKTSCHSNCSLPKVMVQLKTPNESRPVLVWTNKEQVMTRVRQSEGTNTVSEWVKEISKLPLTTDQLNGRSKMGRLLLHSVHTCNGAAVNIRSVTLDGCFFVNGDRPSEQVRGLRSGACVTRGPDWIWPSWQDGGAGNLGRVLELAVHEDWVYVRWFNTSYEDSYRYGHQGCFDLLPQPCPRATTRNEEKQLASLKTRNEEKQLASLKTQNEEKQLASRKTRNEEKQLSSLKTRNEEKRLTFLIALTLPTFLLVFFLVIVGCTAYKVSKSTNSKQVPLIVSRWLLRIKRKIMAALACSKLLQDDAGVVPLTQ